MVKHVRLPAALKLQERIQRLRLLASHIKGVQQEWSFGRFSDSLFQLLWPAVSIFSGPCKNREMGSYYLIDPIRLKIVGG